MLQLNYLNSEEKYNINFKIISPNVVQIKGDIPIQLDGFQICREETPDDVWDYLEYKTLYREIDGGVQFSNDGSVYVEPEEYVPTLEELIESKVAEMNVAQQTIIQAGVDVVLSDGTTEHFTLTEHDQTSLMGLQSQVALGSEAIPWHTSDQSKHCKFYSNADMSLIVSTALQYVTWHVTYFRDLRIFIRSMKSEEELNAVVYGMPIPEEYRSEPLKAMMAMQGM